MSKVSIKELPSTTPSGVLSGESVRVAVSRYRELRSVLVHDVIARTSALEATVRYMVMTGGLDVVMCAVLTLWHPQTRV